MTDDAAWVQRLLPVYRYGVVLPGVGDVQRGVDYQFYRIAPLSVMQIGTGIGIRDYSVASVEAAMERFWDCVEQLQRQEADCIVLSGVPVSTRLGRTRVLALADEVRRRTQLPFYSTMEAVISALASLGAQSVAVASRFPDEVNASLVEYLVQAGLTVAAITSRDVSLGQAQTLTLAEGMRLTLEVGREASQRAGDADALLLPGGAAPSLHAIPAMEEEYHRPAITNLSAEVWATLIRPGIAPPVNGWGQLLASAVSSG
ncbi:MAG TPA: hypothetical protein VMV93_02580 [Chloroflexota bacterium]|nr:hypothetical protein [Chloroflexota bacterium]